MCRFGDSSQARRLSPSIIFLDEFDALGCHRSQNVNHHAESNVVSTLLALIDGLDDRGLVFVIAATNRLDAIDPAFRRAGRFDVEIPFELPNQEVHFYFLDKQLKYLKQPRGRGRAMQDYYYWGC